MRRQSDSQPEESTDQSASPRLQQRSGVVPIALVGYHFRMAQADGRLTPQQAKRLAGYILMRQVDGVVGDRTTEWRYRKLAESVGLLDAFENGIRG